MTRESYKEIYNDDPTDWPKIIHQYEFDWSTPDIVFVAEYYKVEEKTETIRIFETIGGVEERYTAADFENDETLEETLIAIGTREVRQKRVKRMRVRQIHHVGRQGAWRMQATLQASASRLLWSTASAGLWTTSSAAWAMCAWPKMPSA
jgi:hypothetical protein